MRPFVTAAALFGLTVAPVLAQPVPPGANPETGARPGNVIGTGNSLPMSGRASNIDPGDTRSIIAPRLPAPPVAENAGPRQYLMAARAALQRGRTGEAQEALERAEARMLDRSVPAMRADQPIQGPRVSEVSQAREALGHGNIAGAIQIIDALLPKLGG